jgi:hypothetical protein
MVADLSGALLKVAFPFAWSMAMPTMDQAAFIAWIAVAVLYIVHRVALSGATHVDGAKRKVMQIDVTMDSENATKIGELVETARQQHAQSMQ